MPDEFLEMKKLIIDELVGQIDESEKKALAKEFNLTKDRIDSLIKKLLDKWLNNPDYILFIASMLGLSMPRKTKERKAHYIG